MKTSNSDFNADLAPGQNPVETSVASWNDQNDPFPYRTSRTAASAATPSVFDYVDYRAYLKDFYQSRKSANPSYSMTAFTKRAGLKENSRGFLKMVIEKKRNLTAYTLLRFIDALGLKGREANYFENLVNYGQAKEGKDKELFLKRLEDAAAGQPKKQFELIRSQLNYYSRWYYVAVRELVDLDAFEADPAWICTHLRNRITKKEAEEALADLLRLGLLIKDEKGKIRQAEPLIKFGGSRYREAMDKFQLEMMDQAKDTVAKEDADARDLSSVTLSCSANDFEKIKNEITQFRDKLVTQYGPKKGINDTVYQINIQLFQITPVVKKAKKI